MELSRTLQLLNTSYHIFIHILEEYSDALGSVIWSSLLEISLTRQSILLFALDITEKGLGWSHQKRPHAPPDIANYLMLSVVRLYVNYEDSLLDEGGIRKRSLCVKGKVLEDVAVRWHFLAPGEELIVVRVKD